MRFQGERVSKIIGIDASRCRSGGGVAHLLGIITGGDPLTVGVSTVHLWTYQALMNQIPDYPWLIKHTPSIVEKSIFHQLFWQYRTLPKLVKKYGCDLLFNTDAGTICPFRPNVTISQDMLSYEPGEMWRFGFSKAIIRLILLRFIQTRSLRRANGAIFLTRYAEKVIQKHTGSIRNRVIIPHGVGILFQSSERLECDVKNREIRCLYVSNVSMYKHQWHVVRAIGLLRKQGYNLSLLLVGGGAGRAQKKLERELKQTDPHGEFVQQMGFVRHEQLASLLSEANVFIFASSCENMPNTLIEAMASGLPIACSNRGPMPEVLADGGVYFDPEEPQSLVEAMKQLIHDKSLRHSVAMKAQQLSEQYSWERCAHETWSYLQSVDA